MLRNILCCVLFLFYFPAALAAKNLIVIRHAERVQGVDALTPFGIDRAKTLRNMLATEKVGLILSTPLNRSIQTVVPLAQNQEIEITNYSDLNELTSKITASSADTVVVVGHSNTVPEIVKLFSGVIVAPIGETECDRFYVISLDSKNVLKLKYSVGNIVEIKN